MPDANAVTDSLSIDDEISAAEAQLKEAQARLDAARNRAREESSAQPYNAQSDSSQPDSNQFYNAQSDSSQPGNGQAYGAQPCSNQSDSAQPYGAQPYEVPGSVVGAPSYAPSNTSSKDHVAAGLLAVFLGIFGVHKFYLGYNVAGFTTLAVTIVGSLLSWGLAGIVMAIIAIVEGIIYLTKSQSDFEQTYVFNTKEWF